MMRELLNYVLAGALAASLALHFRDPSSAPAPEADGTSCVEGMPQAWESVALTPVQREALTARCLPLCRQAEEVEQTVTECAGELEQALADIEREPDDVRALARRLGELRSREIELCVESMLEVRSVLEGDQLAELVEACAAADCCEWTE